MNQERTYPSLMGADVVSEPMLVAAVVMNYLNMGKDGGDEKMGEKIKLPHELLADMVDSIPVIGDVTGSLRATLEPDLRDIDDNIKSLGEPFAELAPRLKGLFDK